MDHVLSGVELVPPAFRARNGTLESFLQPSDLASLTVGCDPTECGAIKKFDNNKRSLNILWSKDTSKSKVFLATVIHDVFLWWKGIAGMKNLSGPLIFPDYPDWSSKGNLFSSQIPQCHSFRSWWFNKYLYVVLSFDSFPTRIMLEILVQGPERWYSG